MFERFTVPARRVVVLAHEEAGALGHGHIGTEHLLLGMIGEGEGVAARALEACGVTPEAARREVEEMAAPAATAPETLPFTPRAKKVLELSLREAHELGHADIRTEHILLGLVREGQGLGARVLVKLDADLSLVRQQVIQLLSIELPGQVEGDPGG